jgi:hypothetical protein
LLETPECPKHKISHLEFNVVRAFVKNREPEFNPYLGLAVEQLKEGITIEQLWSVL